MRIRRTSRRRWPVASGPQRGGACVLASPLPGSHYQSPRFSAVEHGRIGDASVVYRRSTVESPSQQDLTPVTAPTLADETLFTLSGRWFVEIQSVPGLRDDLDRSWPVLLHSVDAALGIHFVAAVGDRTPLRHPARGDGRRSHPPGR